MRKLILIAALTLVSANAQAGETRSLSLAGSEPQTTGTASTKAIGSQMADVAPVPEVRVEAPKADTPRYVERQPAAETKADEPRYKDEPRYNDDNDKPRSRRESRYNDDSRYDDEPRSRRKASRYDDEPRYNDKPRSRREARYEDDRRDNDEPRYRNRDRDESRRYNDDDDDRPRSKRHWAERRIVNELHRRGIYW